MAEMGFSRSSARRFSVSAVLLLILIASSVSTGLSTTMELDRAFRRSAVSMEVMRSQDRARHERLLQSSGYVADFPVEGSGDPFTVGLYYTQVMLGNPPKEFYVQIDTGSDTLWVNCASCSSCPISSALNIQLNFFDPNQSSTSSFVSCEDQGCISAIRSGEAECLSFWDSSSQCSYTFTYGDGSSTSGYYLFDSFHINRVLGNNQSGNASAIVLFGCSTSQTGELTQSERAVDGIFGFGRQDISVISQLSSSGVVPKVFSHCLKGTDKGGGILVLGEIIEPGIVYTPIVQSQPHYNLNLTSIEVDGERVPIDPSAFTTAYARGTIIDSGTTLAYLADKAYDPFVNAIISSISLSSVNVLNVKGNQCFVTASSVDQVFPSVTLNFDGGASMTLKPDHYLIQQGSIDNAAIMCIGWLKNTGNGMTILGDLILKDKIVVYDLGCQRIGWKDYDCSLPVNVNNISTGDATGLGGNDNVGGHSSGGNDSGGGGGNNNNGGINVVAPEPTGTTSDAHTRSFRAILAAIVAHVYAYVASHC